MAIIGLFQCDPWCPPTQNWLKSATNDISIPEFHNVTGHYVKDTDWNELDWQINHFLTKTSSILFQIHIRNFTSKVITIGSFPKDNIHRGVAKVRFFDVKAKFQLSLQNKKGVRIDKLKIEPFKYKLRLDNIIGLLEDPFGWFPFPTPKSEFVTNIFRKYGKRDILKVTFLLLYLLTFTNT